MSLPWALDETHDPTARSWVESANTPATPFPLQNLPFGSLRPPGQPDWRLGAAIGDMVLDLRAVADGPVSAGLGDPVRAVLRADRLNALLSLPPEAWTAVRRHLFLCLREDAFTDVVALLRPALYPLSGVELRVPMQVGGYTDFFASIHHARRTAKLLRGADEVALNYRHLPVGYNGRASSIVVSGATVRRPSGQSLPQGAAAPVFGPTQKLDYELELAAVIGGENALGAPVPVSAAEDRLFGLCLLNDWSARDIQAFEYQPLGPFLGKSFATTVSPWVVTMDALRPFRRPLEPHAAGDPEPLAHLREPAAAASGVAVHLAATISSEAMRRDGRPAVTICSTSADHLYWSFAQMIAHHTSNGCNLQPGDLLGSGTVSGPAESEAACLLELTANGTRPIGLGNGEARTYLADGDELAIEGVARAEGRRWIGFGPCRGIVAA